MNRDSRFESVRAACDPDRVRDLLNACLVRRGRTGSVEKVVVERVLYLPGVDFSVCYRIEIQDGPERSTQLLSGSIHYAQDDRDEIAKTERRLSRGRYQTARLGEAAYHLPELGMVVLVYPNDPKLRTLRPCLEMRETRQTLQELGGSRSQNGNGGGLGDVQQTLVRYVPRKRCLFRYDLEWTSGDPGPRQVFAKVYENQTDGHLVSQTMEALWRASQADARWLRMPRPIRFEPSRCRLWQTALPGVPLASRATCVTPELVRRIGRGLALLQLARLPVRPVLSLDEELGKTRKQARFIALAHPEFEASLDETMTRLGAALPGLPRLPLLPAHGTFKLNHLLYDGHQLHLVDFDSMVRADPLYDVANFVADLHYNEAQGLVPAGRTAVLEQSFYDAYSAHVPWGRRDTVYDWYVASLLVRKQAMKCVKHLHPDARSKIQRLLDEARVRLGRKAE